MKYYTVILFAEVPVSRKVSSHVIIVLGVSVLSLSAILIFDFRVIGFTTTYTISAYHHKYCEFESRSGHDVQHYVIKFVSDLGHNSSFLRVFRFPPPVKLTATI